MGIKNINLLLTQKCSECIVRKNLKEYSGKIIAIDISIYLYKYIYNNNDHLDGLTRQILRLFKNGIIPLYVFDGEPPKEKDDVLQNRYIKKSALIKKKEELEILLKKDNIEDIDNIKKELDKVNKKIIRITKSHITKCKELFNLFGVPYITSNGEAECLCAKLSRDGLVYGCMSEDTDILANGGKIFIRNFSPSNNIVTEYVLEDILKKLEINYEEFIEICILSGCDYTTKISGIGPINAHKFIKSYKNIDNIINNINSKENPKFNKYKIPSNFDYKKARELFLNTDKNIDTNIHKEYIKIIKPNIEGLLKFLRSESPNLHQKYYREINKSLFKYYSNCIR